MKSSFARIALAFVLLLTLGTGQRHSAIAQNLPPACRDQVDNDKDGLIDFPADPGCTDPEDTDETDPPPPPPPPPPAVCGDGACQEGETCDGCFRDCVCGEGTVCQPSTGQCIPGESSSGGAGGKNGGGGGGSRQSPPTRPSPPLPEKLANTAAPRPPPKVLPPPPPPPPQALSHPPPPSLAPAKSRAMQPPPFAPRFPALPSLPQPLFSLQTETPALHSQKLPEATMTTGDLRSVPGRMLAILSDPLAYERRRLGYDQPILDPDHILPPTRFFSSPDAWLVNVLIAILVTTATGLLAALFHRLPLPDQKRAWQMLGRFPLQMVCALLLLWCLRLLIPHAVAQGFLGTTLASFPHLPFAILFFLVVGTSNFVLNNIVESHGDTLHFMTQHLPLLSTVHDWYSRWESHHKLHRWTVLLALLLAYALIGAHVNASFRILPSQNIGMVLVTFATLLISAYLNDLCKFFVALRWKCAMIWKPHLAGLLLAVLCVLISRTVSVSPGYLYGIPIGLFILSSLEERDTGILECFGIFWMLIFALSVWGVTPFVGSYQIVSDCTNLLYVVLIEGIFFYLLPLGYLPGAAIFSWKKWVWALLFFLDVFLLFHTLFNPNSTLGSLSKNPPTLNTLFLLGTVASVSFCVWGYLMLKKRGEAT